MNRKRRKGVDVLIVLAEKRLFTYLGAVTGVLFTLGGLR